MLWQIKNNAIDYQLPIPECWGESPRMMSLCYVCCPLIGPKALVECWTLRRPNSMKGASLMNEIIQKALDLLKQIQSDLSHNTQNHAEEKLSASIELLEQALESDCSESITFEKLLLLLSEILPACGQIAHLVKLFLERP